jgi:hypothetical protein
MKKLLLAGTTVLLMATSANATLYDRYGRIVQLQPGWSHVSRSNVNYWYRYGVYTGYAVNRGNVSRVYLANGRQVSTIRNYGGGYTQSWDTRGRPLYSTR